ncbi:MAG: efflux RND transporter periplasmic adaptor subunit [Nitrospira sp.]|nr:efflux RND transporter periplasmic adaptor subunit [Nitrospira sp.]
MNASRVELWRDTFCELPGNKVEPTLIFGKDLANIAGTMMTKPLAQVFFAILLLVGCDSKEGTERPEPSSAHPVSIQAEILEVTHTSVPIRIEVTGQVTATFQAVLSSRIQGSIDRLMVREGITVTKGQTLVRLDNRDVEADLARAAADVENTKAHLARMSQLYDRDAVSKQEMENATRAFKVAEASHKAVLAQLSYTVVKAPFDGVITEKLVETGELASPGQPLLRMENPRRLRLEAVVAERDLKAVSPGDKIPVIIDALEGLTLDGVVGKILPVGDSQTHTFTVRVDIPPTPGLKTGMFGRLQLDKGMSTTILVPETAVIQRGEIVSVFAVGQNRVARLRWVKVGRRIDHQVEILSGLNVGESVLLDASHGIDGASVTVVEMPGSATTQKP